MNRRLSRFGEGVGEGQKSYRLRRFFCPGPKGGARGGLRFQSLSKCVNTLQNKGADVLEKISTRVLTARISAAYRPISLESAEFLMEKTEGFTCEERAAFGILMVMGVYDGKFVTEIRAEIDRRNAILQTNGES